MIPIPIEPRSALPFWLLPMKACWPLNILNPASYPGIYAWTSWPISALPLCHDARLSWSGVWGFRLKVLKRLRRDKSLGIKRSSAHTIRHNRADRCCTFASECFARIQAYAELEAEACRHNSIANFMWMWLCLLTWPPQNLELCARKEPDGTAEASFPVHTP